MAFGQLKESKNPQEQISLATLAAVWVKSAKFAVDEQFRQAF